MSIPKSSVLQAGLQWPSSSEQPVLRLQRTVSMSYPRIHNPGFRARRPHDLLPITYESSTPNCKGYSAPHSDSADLSVDSTDRLVSQLHQERHRAGSSVSQESRNLDAVA